jgi:hypothetical protein
VADVERALSRPDLLREEAPGQWLLNANLRVAPGGSLRIAAPDMRWLKLRSAEHGRVSNRLIGGAKNGRAQPSSQTPRRENKRKHQRVMFGDATAGVPSSYLDNRIFQGSYLT